MKPQLGDIYLYSGPWTNPASAVIRLATKSKWSHCGWILDEYTALEALTSGVQKTPLGFYLYPDIIKRIKILRPKTHHLIDIFKQAASVAENELIGKPYDYPKIVSLAWSILTAQTLRKGTIDISSGYICSELIVKPINKLGFRVAKKVPLENIWPGHLDDESLFDVIKYG